MSWADDFNRANSTELGANWEPGYTDTGGSNTALQIVGNRLRAITAGVDATETFTGATLENDQWAQITLPTWTGASIIVPRVLLRFAGPGAKNGYEFGAVRGGTWTSAIAEWNAGVWTSLVSENATTWAVGDILRAEAEGTALRLYRNGGLLLSTTDATFTSGRAGITIYAGTLTDVEVDDFSTGNFGALSRPLSGPFGGPFRGTL